MGECCHLTSRQQLSRELSSAANSPRIAAIETRHPVFGLYFCTTLHLLTISAYLDFYSILHVYQFNLEISAIKISSLLFFVLIFAEFSYQVSRFSTTTKKTKLSPLFWPIFVCSIANIWVQHCKYLSAALQIRYRRAFWEKQN